MLSAFVGLLALLALIAALVRGAGRTPASEQRLRTLEAQVAWLHRETQRLRAEIAVLRGEAEAPAAAPPEAAEAAEVPDAPAASAERPPSPSPAPAAGLWQRLLSGNPLAKVGVVLLFFGVASALRLAADYGFLPVQLRLLAGATGGLAMIAFGWRKARRDGHAAFGIAVQGGGFAILYLIVYFMLARYALIGPLPAFAGFAALGLACVALAAAQDGEALAVFGLAGAFFAPVLAATGSNDPWPLFAYFALLNVFIVGVTWKRAWRVLAAAGFLLTLGVGMAWGLEHYRADHYPVTQGFLIFFWALYSGMPVATHRLAAPGRAGWSSAGLLFGTPLVGFALQSQLAGDRYELAWAALAAALWYAALWLVLYRRPSDESSLLERALVGLAIAFASLAVPLAFGVQVTAAFWALEGVALLWFGVAQGRRPAVAGGILLQAAAGTWFLANLEDMERALPVFNTTCLGMLLLAGAGYASARQLRRGAALPALLWALGWWLAAGMSEIAEQVPGASAVVLDLVFLAATLAACLRQGREWSAAAEAGGLPGVVLALFLLWSNLTQPGAVVGLPYLPLLNAFDFAQLAALAALFAWQRRVAAAGGFVWLSGLAARIAHHWGGVPFTAHALWHSTLLQALLTLLWTLLAIAAMIRAARAGERRLWQRGFGLLAVVGGKLLLVDLANAGTLLWTVSLLGVALLVLAAAYFAPVPPRQRE